MPSQKPDPEVAKTNAELAAEHVESAEEAAKAAERELAEATKEDPNSRLCPDDNTEMVQHRKDHPHHPGYWHCNTCGKCAPARSLSRSSG